MRIGSRRSALALAQAQLVAALLDEAEVVPIATSGDGGALGDKTRWVDTLERSLQEGLIDLAVHSAKDVPSELGEGLELLGAPRRAAAEDVLCGAPGIEHLRRDARVGTRSLRRVAQLRAARADIEVVPIAGNVDTRLAKLSDRDQRLDAIVLARAGLVRLGREREANASLDPAEFVPAPGQGTLAIEGRADDETVRAAVAAICDSATFDSLLAERAVARALGADCDTPLGAYALGDRDSGLLLRAWVGLPDGSAWAADELRGSEPEALGAAVAQRLRALDAEQLLVRAREMAPGER
jgi:hydroxymethylbilane synthase